MMPRLCDVKNTYHCPFARCSQGQLPSCSIKLSLAEKGKPWENPKIPSLQFCDKRFVPFLTTKVTDFRTAGPMGDPERKREPRMHDDISVPYLSPLVLR